MTNPDKDYYGDDDLSVEEEVADVLWTLPFEDGTLTIRDAEMAAKTLRESGLLIDDDDDADYEDGYEVQWGVAKREGDETTYRLMPTEKQAQTSAARTGATVVKRRVSSWIPA